MEEKPGLFGIYRSNRDYTKPDTWGKNQFNSSFPAALACYLYSKGLSAVYYKANKNMKIEVSTIGIDTLFGIEPLSEDIYFSFETPYMPYQKYVKGSIPRNDLVILENDKCLSSMEIKLVALPDNATCALAEDKFGAEIVVRPDTIVYLACSIIQNYKTQKELENVLAGAGANIENWTEAEKVLPYITEIYWAIRRVVIENYEKQVPVIMEPVWKTEGKSPKLSKNCLDVFVWSNLGMLNLFMPEENEILYKISRHTRTMIWLFRMLADYAKNGYFDGRAIIDALSYNLKNDKAFSSNGQKTQPLMTCEELIHPRIQKDEIKKIILGGGQNLLSPERRFDAIIYNSPDLFEETNRCND
ncbi:MAG: HindVP family restriction endonuclease [bacterium]|nr:HindVP family restriction endonuclease [bacterium]